MSKSQCQKLIPTIAIASILTISIPFQSFSSELLEKKDTIKLDDEVERQILVKTKDTKLEIPKNIINTLSKEEKIDRRTKMIQVKNKKDKIKLIEALRANNTIEYIEEDQIAKAQYIPNDQYYQYQWNMRNLNLEKTWDLTRGNVNVTVAVVDTGVAYENYGNFKKAQDFSSTRFTQPYDFVNNDGHANDDEGHGTHVAGTIAASANDNYGVSGIAPLTTIMPVKVLDGSGRGSYSDIAKGIIYAADNGADVINLSLGASYSSRTLEDAVEYAYKKNVVLLGASGNDGRRSIIYPASYDEVIAIGATRIDNEVARYSNYGSDLDFALPGGDLSVDQDRNGYGDGILQETLYNAPNNFAFFFYQGTSMATAHASGLVALLKSIEKFENNDVFEILKNSAVDIEYSGKDSKSGYGMIDAKKMIDLAIAKRDNASAEDVIDPSENTIPSDQTSPSTEQPTQEVPSKEQLSVELKIADRYQKERPENIFANNDDVYLYASLKSPNGKVIKYADYNITILKDETFLDSEDGKSNYRGEIRERILRRTLFEKNKGTYRLTITITKDGYNTFSSTLNFRVE